MSFSDIEFGWRTSVFSLIDLQVSRTIELLQPKDDGEWVQRDADEIGLYVDTKEEKQKEVDNFENIQKVKYSKPQRVLYALLTVRDGKYKHQEMYLGGELDKSTKPSDCERIYSIPFTIKEIINDDIDLPKLLKSNHVCHYEYKDDIEGSSEQIYMQLYLPSYAFDSIDTMIQNKDSAVNVTLNIKGWSTLGCLGDLEIYFERNKEHPIELVEFMSTQTFGSEEVSEK